MPILSLGNMYLSAFIESNRKAEKYPLDLVLCQECYLLQLRHNAPLAKLYNDNYGYLSGINATMREELADVVKKASSFLQKSKKNIVIDIGCNDGTLLSDYPQSVTKVGFDPVKKFAKTAKKKGIVFVNDYFHKRSLSKKYKEKKVQVITAISMFYDLEDPNAFVEDIADILDTNGVCIIQQNYVVGMLKEHAYDNIVHEHLEYYSLYSLEQLLKRHGLEVFDVEERDINGGSFRTYIRHTGSNVQNKNGMKKVATMRTKEKKLRLDKPAIYKKFAGEVSDIAKKLKTFVVSETKKGKTVAIYGASTRGNTILQYCGLDNTYISFAAERNPEKWGRHTLGTNIPIISEEEARKRHPDYFLVLPWFFKAEFENREKNYLKKGGKFIFPLPKFEVVHHTP